MHIAFDGGCFQQGILGGIHHVACGFLNAARQADPDLCVTLVCDSRQGMVQPAALSGLSWTPDVVMAPVAKSYDAGEDWPSTTDPHIRFFVDGRIVPAEVKDHVARYAGPPPERAFAILSRSARPMGAKAGGEQRRGISIETILVSSAGRTTRISGQDRRLSAGFHDAGGTARWTDGAGFVPLGLFAQNGRPVVVEVGYAAQDAYAMRPGIAAEAVLKARRARRDAERDLALQTLAAQLRAEGCTAYVANHFTPLHMPGMINAAWAYDLIPVLLPRYFHADAQANFRQNLAIFAKADRIYAISDCTRNDLISHAAIRPEQVISVGIAASAAYAPQDSGATRALLKTLGLRPQGYILAVATIEPRKNHLRLLHAYLELRRRLPDCPDLVLVGKMGWDFQQVLSFRAESGLEHIVRILSDRSDQDLACLYSGALFSTYLSVYEGFGLPIVEAMACSCPVLTSDRSSMKEVAGDAALLTDPYDIEAIAEAMHELATRAQLRDALSRKGRIRAADFSWQRSSGMVMDDLARLIAAA